MFLYVLIEDMDINDDLKLFNNTHIFERNISEKPFLRPQQMIAETWLTDLLLELAVSPPFIGMGDMNF